MKNCVSCNFPMSWNKMLLIDDYVASCDGDDIRLVEIRTMCAFCKNKKKKMEQLKEGIKVREEFIYNFSREVLENMVEVKQLKDELLDLEFKLFERKENNSTFSKTGGKT